MRGLLLESGNDAAVTLAEGVVRLAQGVRARDEPARPRAGPQAHRTSPTRSGSTRRATTPRARDLVTLAHGAAHELLLQEGRRLAVRRTLKTGVRARTFEQPQPARCASYGFVNGVKTGHTRGAGYVLVGSRRTQRRPARQRRPRHAERGRPRHRHDGALQLRRSRASSAIRAGDQGARDGDARRSATAPAPSSSSSRRARCAGSCCAASATRSRSTSTRRRSSKGPIRSGQRLGRVEVTPGRQGRRHACR